VRLRDIPPIVRAAASILFVAAGIALLYFTWFNGDDSEGEQPAAEVDGVVEVCPSGWRDFDNTALHFKICLPNNLVFQNAGVTTALPDVNQSDPAFVNDFHVVNPAFLNPWPATIPSDPALPPLRIAVRKPAADLGIEGCALRTAPVDAKGVQSCSDLFFILDGQAIPDAAGDFHRYRALFMANGQQLFFQADSMTAAWAAGQQVLVQRVLESIRPY
jgi:hypothetical protein